MERRKSDFNDRVWNDIKREDKKFNTDDNKKSKQCLIKKDRSDDYVLTFMFALKIINRVLTAFILWNLLVITGRML